MATPAQIANDLEEHGKALNGRGHDMLCRSLARGANTIRELMDQITVKETEATVHKLRSEVLSRAEQDRVRKNEVAPDLYQRAVGLMVLSNRVSTSFIQRELGIDYNAAARLVERAEDDGIAAQPNEVGKRELLAKPQRPEVDA
ncbi:MAG: DNA translocase FtsK [Pseudomonadota bacterium]|nr:DNA translocase FtsK [Pseudomonadota bacterium]